MSNRIFTRSIVVAVALLSFAVFARAAEPKKTDAELRQQLTADVKSTIDRFKKTDPGIERFFKESAGYAVFPTVGKLGFILGGGYGEGEVFDAGRLAGVASVSFASVGLQAGAQEYSEIVFFKDKADLDRFKQNKYEFDASASAVIWKSGASKSANYRGGVLVFVQPKGGVMAEAAVGGQKFNFKAEGGAAPK